MYIIKKQHNENIFLLEHPLGFYAIQLADEIIDYNAKHDSIEDNKKNALFAFNLLTNVV